MRKLFIILFMASVSGIELFSQGRGYIVQRASFSSGINDEFSPVFYKEGIVFCSNLRDNSLIGYRDAGERLFKIVYVTVRPNSGWRQPVIFSRELTSGFNDGPATFSPGANTIYFSRNNNIETGLRNISDTENKLGIYSAVLTDSKWTNVTPLPFNDKMYTFCTPSMSPDGIRLYFSSDMPEGYGGLDLYYCDFINEQWSKPVNLGPDVNTSGNETFPFSAPYGILYFASDGHKGFGGKDIYYTRETDGKWISPVHLDSTLNSAADDFGILTDSTLQSGYFSSNRFKTDDIFSFSSAPVEFSLCDTARRNKYCFTFYDERQHLLDTIPVRYVWDFGSGIIKYGAEVYHCFPGPGKYSVKLTILDDLTGDTIADRAPYDVLLEAIEQPVINSSDVGIAGKSLSLNGETSSLKGIRITDYFWNFGDGFSPGGPEIEHVFKRKGEYEVQLGLLGTYEIEGTEYRKCVKKKIIITAGN